MTYSAWLYILSDRNVLSTPVLQSILHVFPALNLEREGQNLVNQEWITHCRTEKHIFGTRDICMLYPDRDPRALIDQCLGGRYTVCNDRCFEKQNPKSQWYNLVEFMFSLNGRKSGSITGSVRQHKNCMRFMHWTVPTCFNRILGIPLTRWN